MAYIDGKQVLFQGVGTKVKIDGATQGEWSADFAESERQKSKNLWAYGDISGTRNNSINFVKPIPEGTYAISAVANSSDTDTTACMVILYGQSGTAIRYLSFERDTRQSFVINPTEPIASIVFYAGTTYDNSEGDTFSYKDIQIEEGTQATNYQKYNGAIAHEKDIEDVEHITTIYDMNSTDSNINQGKTAGCIFGNETQLIQNVKGFDMYRITVWLSNQAIVCYMDGRNTTSFACCYTPDTANAVAVGVITPWGNGTIYPQFIRLFKTSWDSSLEKNERVYIKKVEGINL